jgi:hypothetical protein
MAGIALTTSAKGVSIGLKSVLNAKRGGQRGQLLCHSGKMTVKMEMDTVRAVINHFKRFKASTLPTVDVCCVEIVEIPPSQSQEGVWVDFPRVAVEMGLGHKNGPPRCKFDSLGNVECGNRSSF